MTMNAENTPAPIDTDRDDTVAKFVLSGRRQIRQLLQELIDRHALIGGHFGSGGSFLTALLELSDDEETITLDASPDPETHRRVLSASKLLCVTQLDRIRIQFALHDLDEGRQDGRNVLYAPVPTEMLRLQRRDAFRLPVPLSHAATCLIRTKGVAEPKVEVVGRLLDVSVGGIALQLPPDIAEFVIGSRLEDCQLRLPYIDPIPLQLRVCNISRQEQRSGALMLRIGMSFADLPRSAENAIQRYIFNTERERNARERGGL